MLWQRVVTALVLIPLVVAGILMLDTEVLALIMGAFILLGSYELGHLAGLENSMAIALFATAMAVSLWLVWLFLTPTHLQSVQWIMSAWWVLMTLALVMRRRDLARVEGISHALAQAIYDAFREAR